MSLVIVNGTVFDGTGTDPYEGASITVEDGRFVDVSSRTPHRDDIVIDAEGRTILPGLINAHTHLAGVAFTTGADEVPAGEIAAWIFEHGRRALDLGFTTCRETGGMDGGIVSAWNKGIARGPRMFVCGPALAQTGGHGDFRPAYVSDPCVHHLGIPGLAHTIKVCDGEDGVREAARLAFKRGASFLKLCATGGVTSSSDALTDTQFTEREIRAAVDEAQSRHTYVTVHTHNNEAIYTGLRAGVECFEHVTSLDEDAARAIAEAGAAVVPTLTIAHIYPTLTHFLDNDVIARIADVEDGMRRALKLAHEHGILVGSGADLIGPDQKDYGLETALVAEVVGSKQALLTATRDNAKVLRIDDRLGTIEPGKIADVVLVQGDPFDDPRLLASPENISMVMKDGTVVKDIR